MSKLFLQKIFRARKYYSCSKNVLNEKNYNYNFLSLKVNDIVEIHEKQCESLQPHCPTQLSNDGVSECKSNSASLDVFTMRFEKCRYVYPITIIRPSEKYRVDSKKYLYQVIQDVLCNSCTITMFIGDNPKRAMARDAMGHSSFYACEYCFQKASRFIEAFKKTDNKRKNLEGQIELIKTEINGVKNVPNSQEKLKTLKALLKSLTSSLKGLTTNRATIVWPSSTINGTPRTNSSIREIVQKIKDNPDLTPDERMGIIGESHFLNIDSFNFCRDITCEYLHCVCLGVTKRLLELTFKVGENRPRITKRKLSNPNDFNVLMSEILVPGEFPRRARSLDFAVFKGQEFRNIVIFYFHLVVECIEPSAKERHLWLYLAYVIRACIIPSEEFQNVSLDCIKYACETFYTIYERLFGPKNCTYNTHIVFAHLLQIRENGPLTLSSAFGFESFYGELRNSFTPGTISPLKQILQNVYLKRVLSKHTCESAVTISDYNTPLECNNLVYIYKDERYNFYKVLKIADNVLECVTIEKEIQSYEETPTLAWAKVGVFQFAGEKNDLVKVNVNSVHGKLIRVKNLLITCPNEILREK